MWYYYHFRCYLVFEHLDCEVKYLDGFSDQTKIEKEVLHFKIERKLRKIWIFRIFMLYVSHFGGHLVLDHMDCKNKYLDGFVDLKNIQIEVLHFEIERKLKKIWVFLFWTIGRRPFWTPSWISQNAQRCQLGIVQILILHAFPYQNLQKPLRGVFLQGHAWIPNLATGLKGSLRPKVFVSMKK